MQLPILRAILSDLCGRPVSKGATVRALGARSATSQAARNAYERWAASGMPGPAEAAARYLRQGWDAHQRCLPEWIAGGDPALPDSSGYMVHLHWPRFVAVVQGASETLHGVTEWAWLLPDVTRLCVRQWIDDPRALPGALTPEQWAERAVAALQAEGDARDEGEEG